MAKVFTSEDLIASIQRRASFTDVQSEGKADQDLLDVLDEVLLDEIVPQIKKYREDYFTRTVRLAISSGTTYYPVPTRAVGDSLRDLYGENGADRWPIYLTERDRVITRSQTATSQPGEFYWEGNSIVLVPPGTAGNLVLSFFFRPGQLVLAENYRTVASVDSTTSVTLSSAAPSTWVAGTTTFDVHSAESGAENRVYDYGASVVSSTTLTFSQAIDGSVDGTRAVVAGDYVVTAGHAAVPAIPRDAHPALAQAATCRLLESDGDSEMLRVARETLGRQLQNFGHLFENRVNSKTHVFVNRKSLLFSQGGRR